MTTIEKIIQERKAIWDTQPKEIDEILKRREKDMPLEEISLLESRPRLCAEMIWNFREYYEKGKISEEAFMEFLPIFLRNYAKKMYPDCGVKTLSDLLEMVADEASTATFEEFMSMTDQLRLYMARLSLWADLYLAWQVGNSELRTTLSQQS